MSETETERLTDLFQATHETCATVTVSKINVNLIHLQGHLSSLRPGFTICILHFS